MKHIGIARRAAFKIIYASLVFTMAACCIPAALQALERQSHIISQICFGVILALAAVWMVFALFTIYFFRDPEPNPPPGPGLIVSPGHGLVDAVEQITEPQFMGGPCH